jgi:hypothetical protein
VIGLLTDFSTVRVEGCCCTDVGTGLVKMSCECPLSASFGNEASFIAVSVTNNYMISSCTGYIYSWV